MSKRRKIKRRKVKRADVARMSRDLDELVMAAGGPRFTAAVRKSWVKGILIATVDPSDPTSDLMGAAYLFEPSKEGKRPVVPATLLTAVQLVVDGQVPADPKAVLH